MNSQRFYLSQFPTCRISTSRKPLSFFFVYFLFLFVFPSPLHDHLIEHKRCNYVKFARVLEIHLKFQLQATVKLTTPPSTARKIFSSTDFKVLSPYFRLFRFLFYQNSGKQSCAVVSLQLQRHLAQHPKDTAINDARTWILCGKTFQINAFKSGNRWFRFITETVSKYNLLQKQSRV